MPKIFQRGETYRDTGSVNDPSDRFIRWINVPGKTGVLNTPGIRPLLFSERHALKLEVPAAIILVTTEKTHSGSVWKDVVDIAADSITYWGDARKHDMKRPLDWKGNRVLQSVADHLAGGEPPELIPPILHFSKPEGGSVVFNGLCSLEKLVESVFEHDGAMVTNLRAELRILGADEVDAGWLQSRALSRSLPPASTGEPVAWAAYVNSSNERRTSSANEDLKPTSDPDELRSRVARLKRRRNLPEPKGNQSPKTHKGTSTSFERCPDVIVYVLRLAEGCCELCGTSSPFSKAGGEPYLEVHHVVMLSEGGPDTIDNAAALCPNCHRHLHHGRDAVQRVEVLYAKVKRLKRMGVTGNQRLGPSG